MTVLNPIDSPGPTPSDSAEHADHRQRLQELRRFRVEQLATLDAEAPASPRHDSVRRALQIGAAAALTEIDAALTRMDEGWYGQCVSCEGEIEAERLDILPMAPLCMTCHYNRQNCQVAALSNNRPD
jgi:RNA polymerase-binding transcription factor DksA